MNDTSVKNLTEFLRQFVAGVTNTQLYSINHPQVQRQIGRCLTALALVHKDHPHLSLFILEDQLILDDKPVPASLYVGKYCQLMAERGISHIKISPGVSHSELGDFIARLSQPASAEGIRSSSNIRLGTAEIQLGHAGDGERSGTTAPLLTEADAKKQLDNLSDEEVSRFLELYDAIRHHRKFNMVGITEIVSDLVRVFATEANPLMALAPLRAMDEYTFTHSTNVCILNLAQATSLGIKGQLLHDVGVAAMLHDIGKLFIPEEILNKPGKLDDQEWAVIQEHPERGAHYLLNSPGIPQLAVITAYEHHMRYDLKGYPAVKNTWKLNLCSQLTMISDTFDAVRSSRVYQSTSQQDEALAVLTSQAGSSLNPILVKNFAEVLKGLKNAETDNPEAPQ